MCVTFGPKSLDVLIFQEIKVLLWVFKKILGPKHRIRYIVPNAEVFSVMKTLPFKKKTVRQRLPRFKPAQYQVLPLLPYTVPSAVGRWVFVVFTVRSFKRSAGKVPAGVSSTSWEDSITIFQFLCLLIFTLQVRIFLYHFQSFWRSKRQ